MFICLDEERRQMCLHLEKRSQQKLIYLNEKKMEWDIVKII